MIILFYIKVLIVGLGGLGNAALLPLLKSQTIKQIGLCDNDKIEASNLNRQLLYTQKDIGQPKTTIALQKAQKLCHPTLELNTHTCQINAQNATNIIKNYDIIVDCTDNFNSRYLINDACMIEDKIMVHSAIDQHMIYLSVFKNPTIIKKRLLTAAYFPTYQKPIPNAKLISPPPSLA